MKKNDQMQSEKTEETMLNEEPQIEEADNAKLEKEEDEEKKEGNDEYKEKYVRLLAEYTNAMRQKDAEIQTMAKFGNRNLLIKVIDIADDIEIGLAQENLSSETKGVLELLQSKVDHLLSMEGVSAIDFKPGDVYDPNKCEVITMIDDDNNKGKIAVVVRKGYSLGDRILRTSKVVVGK